MEELLKDLNLKQREAVLATEGPLLILAGPGSGKTKALAHRIAHLIQRGIAPENILAVTFTNKAANEMRERVVKIVKNETSEVIGRARRSDDLNDFSPFIGTFHSLAVRILRAHASKIGFFSRFTIFDDDDSRSLLKEIMKGLEINPKQFPVGVIASVISGLKNELVSPEQYAEDSGTMDLFPRMIHGVYLN